MIGPERVIEKIKDGVQSKKINGDLGRHRPHRPQARHCGS